ncbi:MAG: CbtA family protein [Methylobacter sp.]
MFNLNTFKQLLTAALKSGLLAGMALTAVQLLADVLHTEIQTQNTIYRAIANIGLGVGFALLLGSVMCLKGRPANWRVGLLWGLAGYLTFCVAPSLGLPPELPGTETAKLADQQNRWLMIVFDTGFGLSLLAFAQTRTNKFFGAVLLVAPYLMGAPKPEVAVSTTSSELAEALIGATAIANAVFWLAIGGFMQRFYKKGLPN